ncbi:hypothetical protein GPECTOR_53g130 [Gonium pectorale]|uniref:Peptidase M43 pregnancy-associated plasma-A domain-containing protein n=1 Tax=Gonium pectorale TaxID=33097 RepID=A0A150G6T2_GONPE|nr:hypothetical protein GPECTOR_53g130 [Gonium pectorale]|eukprot:KXZ45544.1 hypothetical protein GPECTOR_53g130 [Gonium pectorale]
MVVPWLLLVAAFQCFGAIPTRLLLQDVDAESTDPFLDGFIKEVPDSGYRPFLALKDTVSASGKDVQQLYEQGSSASAIAYLLFAAAEPLSQADGSSASLLPYLAPNIIRLYASRPDRCASSIVRRLYGLSYLLYGSDALKACHYDLYKSLQATFAWVRDNVPLRLQDIPDQPLATAAWPDLGALPASELTAAVAAALVDGPQLGEVAALLTAGCGMDIGAFAGLIPYVSAVLADLHLDVATLQEVASHLHDSRWAPDDQVGVGDGNNQEHEHEDDSDQRISVTRAAADGRSLLGAGRAWAGAGAGHLLVGLERPVGHRRRPVLRRWLLRRRGDGEGEWPGVEPHQARYPDPDSMATGAELLGPRDGNGAAIGTMRRRLAVRYVPSNYMYDMPPGGFVAADPATKPKLYIPVIFHVMLYTDTNGSIAPAKAAQAPVFVDRIVRVANYMAAPTNIQFWAKEVRNNATAYPYLLLANRSAWLSCPKGGSTGYSCLYNSTFTKSTVTDFPRSINVFVVSDSTGGAGVALGYAWVPGSDTAPDSGHVYMTWDGLSTDGSNSLSLYNDGPNTLLHELFHHLGIYHTFTGSTGSTNACNNDDYGPASSASFSAIATAYCMELFWGTYGGDWEAAYQRWSTTLGIPAADMNAWADTCPSRAGYDELGNYMTYNTPVCFAGLGHFTPGQVERAHYITAELNPVLYAWGQYYAQNAPPPPLQSSPPPETYTHICKATRSNCACKSSWVFNNNSYSYCDRIGTTNLLT